MKMQKKRSKRKQRKQNAEIAKEAKHMNKYQSDGNFMDKYLHIDDDDGIGKRRISESDEEGEIESVPNKLLKPDPKNTDGIDE